MSSGKISQSNVTEEKKSLYSKIAGKSLYLNPVCPNYGFLWYSMHCSILNKSRPHKVQAKVDANLHYSWWGSN